MDKSIIHTWIARIIAAEKNKLERNIACANEHRAWEHAANFQYELTHAPTWKARRKALETVLDARWRTDGPEATRAYVEGILDAHNR